MGNWVVARVRSGFEFACGAAMQETGADCYIPTVESVQRVRHKRKPVSVKKPMYPGYSFVALEGLPFDRLREIRNVFGFLRNGRSAEYATLDDGEIEAIRALEKDRRLLDERTMPRLRAGERVAILAGAFAGREGSIVKINGVNAILEVVNAERLDRVKVSAFLLARVSL